MKRLLAFAVVVALSACGTKEEPQQTPAPQAITPYGSLDEVTSYLVKINPFIQRIVGIQQQVDQAVGTTGKATGRNLSGVMEKARPLLMAVKEEFKAIAAPAGLTPLRDDIIELIDLRLDAYQLTMDGWQAEQASNDLSLYNDAQAKLDEANGIIEGLNDHIQKINDSIRQAAGQPQVASP